MQTFGDRLTLEIERRGMTQRELARQLEVSPQAVNGWVQGTSQPSWARLLKLEDALGVPRGELMAILGYQAPTDDGGPLVTLEDAIRSDPEIGAEGKRALLRLVKALRAEAKASG